MSAINHAAGRAAANTLRPVSEQMGISRRTAPGTFAPLRTAPLISIGSDLRPTFQQAILMKAYKVDIFLSGLGITSSQGCAPGCPFGALFNPVTSLAGLGIGLYELMVKNEHAWGYGLIGFGIISGLSSFIQLMSFGARMQQKNLEMIKFSTADEGRRLGKTHLELAAELQKLTPFEIAAQLVVIGDSSPNLAAHVLFDLGADYTVPVGLPLSAYQNTAIVLGPVRMGIIQQLDRLESRVAGRVLARFIFFLGPRFAAAIKQLSYNVATRQFLLQEISNINPFMAAYCSRFLS